MNEDSENKKFIERVGPYFIRLKDRSKMDRSVFIFAREAGTRVRESGTDPVTLPMRSVSTYSTRGLADNG